jgi:hypothetical protein
MDPPQFLLDALNNSITSGTFADTKFYVFSHREASGFVGSPRSLYCNSRVLNTVPYFSSCRYRESLRHCTPNRIALKCSPTHSRKDSRGISTGDSPPTPPPLRFTTTYLIAISKMNPRALKRSIQDLPRVITPSSLRDLKHKIRARKRLRPHPWSSRQQIRVGSWMTTGWLRHLSDRPKVNFASDLMMVHQEWENLS